MSCMQQISATITGMDISFSPSIVVIPVATVCPINIGNKSVEPTNAVPFDLIPLPTVTTSSLINSIFSASAVMADGSVTTFLSLTQRELEVSTATDLTTTLANGDNLLQMAASVSLATILVGSDGCQTFYSPSMTTVCATIVTPMGLAPVLVTDCNQYVTFSSETLWSCSAIPQITPRPADSSISGSTASDRMFLSVSATTVPASSTTSLPGLMIDDVSITASVTQAELITTSMTTSLDGQGEAGISVSGSIDSDGSLQRRDLIYSAAPDESIPMSLPRHLLLENGSRKRQILVYDGRPISIDLVTVAPTATTVPESTMSSILAASDLVSDALLARFAQVSARARALIHKRQDSASLDTGISTTADMTDSNVDLDIAAEVSPTTVIDPPSPSPHPNLLSDFTMPAPANCVINLSPPQPTKYYVAPWQEIAQGGIPAHIKGMTCYGGDEPVGSCVTPDSDGDTEPCECEVVDEVWSVTSITFSRIGTTVVGYTGNAVVSAANVTSTTSLAFQSTLTTTKTYVKGYVIKKTLTAGATVSGREGSMSDEDMVYATQTSYPTITKTLVPVKADVESASQVEVSSSSTVDAAVGVQATNAGMPQEGPPSISTPTAPLTGADTTPTSILAATDFPVSSVTTPVAAEDVSGSIEGTVFVTSTVATETMTIPPADETGVASVIAPAEAGAPLGVAGARREGVWFTDVWLVDVN